ncbi:MULTISPECIES: phage holin family protein [unclassified Crossiella]|uniref:phage holin family protein n=1 Tax=unclassified Crossiella TaxID=2620835 RepID=UPI001FFEDF61|nr:MULTISPECIES: phage holin family protein [unclassified Crossiella]MCK2237654.1 phage holin family protein [Crossiella sp. S99.2]MCK2254940.1 phage holin family protein [Crossiella sp. S99.1]
MSGVTRAQHNASGSPDGAGLPPVPSIPLSDFEAAPGEQSIGGLVREATTHLSTLIRSELELAKAELGTEVKKGVKGSVYFILALAVLAFSMFFLFFTLGELLSVWLPRWGGFGIVFVLMLVSAGLLGFLGYRRVRAIRGPKRTIETLKDTGKVLPRRHTGDAEQQSA